MPRPAGLGGPSLFIFCDLSTLAGSPVYLRALISTDAPALLVLFGDPRVTQYMGMRTRVDQADASRLIGEIQRHASTGDLFQWGIARNSDDHVVGTVTLASIDRNNRRAEIGFAVSSEEQGQGYARSAVRTALAHAFGELGMHRIEADVEPRNAPSIAVLKRVGFRKEGYLPERWWNEGEWQDSVLFGLLSSDWDGSEG